MILSDQQLGLLLQPGATIPHPSAVRATQQPQAGLIRLRELVAFVLLPGVKAQVCLQGHGLQQARLPLPGGTGQGDQQFIGGFCRWRNTEPMQARCGSAIPSARRDRSRPDPGSSPAAPVGGEWLRLGWGFRAS